MEVEAVDSGHQLQEQRSKSSDTRHQSARVHFRLQHDARTILNANVAGLAVRDGLQPLSARQPKLHHRGHVT